MTHFRPPVLAATLLATNLLFAQGPDDTGNTWQYAPPQATPEQTQVAGTPEPGHKLAALRTPIHTAAADMGIEYGTWATGDDYKVSFHDGMTFIPYLGSDYPKTQSISWTTKSVKLGATEVLGEKTAERAHGSWRYEYEFGTVTEAYDVLAEGLEQTFVLSAKPATGDLVIRGQVTTGLRSPAANTAHQALMFSDGQGRQILNYGAGVAFDANGSRVDVLTSYTNGEITLTVPGLWIEHAALPITVDPLLARVQISGGTADVLSNDIGRDDQESTNTLMTLYSRAASATEFDSWALLHNEDYSQFALAFSDVTTNWKSEQGSCAFVGGTDRWAIVFRRYFVNATTRSSRLRCHIHDSGDVALSTSITALNPPLGTNDWRPDTGGIEAFASDEDAFVVFQREDNTATNNHFAEAAYSKVFGCLIDTSTTNGTFGTPFEISPTNIHDCERPSVNQVAEGGATTGWICVQQQFREGLTNEDWDLVGKRINPDGTVAPGTWFSDMATANPRQHQLSPKIEGSRGRYAVLFTTLDVTTFNYKTALSSGTHVQVERLDWLNNVAGPGTDYPTETVRPGSDRRWEVTDIAFDTDSRSHWTLLYRSIPPGLGYLYYDRIGYNGKSLMGLAPIVYGTPGDQVSQGVAVYDNDHDTVHLAYGVNTSGLWHPVYCQTLTYTAPNSPYTFGTSCSSASLSWWGSQQIGAEFSGPRVIGAPPGSIHIMLAATATTNVPVLHPIVFPGCQLFVMAAGPGYLGAFPTAVGSNFIWQLPLPEFLGSQTLHFQDWHLNANGLLYSTERLTVPITK